MPKKITISEKVWEKVRLEYISSSQVSMRSLEKKYGIPFSQIRNRVKKEDWQQQREELKSQQTQKSVELLADFGAEECTRAFRMASKVLSKIEEVIDQLDIHDEYVTKKIKSITSAIKDLKEIGVYQSEMDRQEQLARIKKLQKEAEEEKKDTTITVNLLDAEEYGE